MKRLTFYEDGKLGVVGMDESNEETKIYTCIKKLKDIEDVLEEHNIMSIEHLYFILSEHSERIKESFKKYDK